jgi:hypothetical protein
MLGTLEVDRQITDPRVKGPDPPRRRRTGGLFSMPSSDCWLKLRGVAMDHLGKERYFEEMVGAWEVFKADGGTPRIGIHVKDRLRAFKKD